MIVFGHRGSAGTALENSRESFLSALAQGASALECDVQWVEGTFFVFHDRRTGRVCTEDVALPESSLECVRALRLRNGESLLELPELLTMVEGKALLNIELKGSRGGKELALLLEKYQPRVKVLVSAFSERALLEFAQNSSNVPLGVLNYGDPVRLDFAWLPRPPAAYHCSLDFLSAELISRVKREGVQIGCYTVNHRTDLERCKTLGVDGVFTDYPGEMLGALGERAVSGFRYL